MILCIMKINNIVSVFKDYLIYDDIGDFLNRMYTMEETLPRLNRVTRYYAKLGNPLPSMAALEEQKFITKNKRRKHRKLQDRLEALEKVKDRENDNFSVELDSFENNKVFDTQMVERILNETPCETIDNDLKNFGLNIVSSMQSYEQNSKILNNTKTGSEIYDLDVLKNIQNTEGTNSFEKLVQEFAENYTDPELSSEIIKRPKTENSSKENIIKISGSNYLEFDSNISIIQEDDKRTSNRNPSRGESKNKKNQKKVCKRNIQLSGYANTKPSVTSHSRRTTDSVKIEDLIKASRSNIYGSKSIKKIKDIPQKDLKFPDSSSKRVISYDKKKYFTKKVHKSKTDKQCKKLSMKFPRQKDLGDCDPLLESKFTIMSTSARSKHKYPKTENKNRRKNRNRIGSLDGFKHKISLSKSRGKDSRQPIKVSKGRKAPGRLSKAASLVSLFGTHNNSQPDSLIKTLKRPRVKVDIRSGGRKSASNLQKNSTHYNLRMSSINDLKEYLTLTKIGTPIRKPSKQKERQLKQKAKSKVSEYKEVKTKVLNIPTIKITGLKELVNNQPKEVVKISDDYTNNFLKDTLKNPQVDNKHVLKVSNVDGSQEKTIIDFINNKSNEIHCINNSSQDQTSFEPSVADEVEYDPVKDVSCEDYSVHLTDMKINERFNECKINLVKQIQPNNFGSSAFRSDSKRKCNYSTLSKNSNNKNLTTRTSSQSIISKVRKSPTPKVLQSTINLRAFRRSQIDSSDQQGLFLQNKPFVSKSGIKSSLEVAPTLKAIASARTRTFINKFNC
ncbi:unnamed protein product [Moneuplotes crassus]|uniref:Uncharacterized protein n=1 Tax=Euplotes crassus TaxID=5936 RepID=A0AAD1Y5P9_EUPCR|nr:unnamed protein product [Moneuplotes crassus]